MAFAHKHFETVFGIPSEYMVYLWISSVEANVHLLSLEFSILTLEWPGGLVKLGIAVLRLKSSDPLNLRWGLGFAS